MKQLLAVLFLLFLPYSINAEVKYLPATDIRSDMKGYGLTVFQGSTPERFEVEVVGVTPFSGDMVLVLAKATKSPRGILDEAKIPGGMSGSPIYLGEQLAGALAYGWLYQSTPLFGFVPFEYMYREAEQAEKGTQMFLKGLPPTIDIPWEGESVRLTRLPLGTAISNPEVYGSGPGFVPGSAIAVGLVVGDRVAGAIGTVTAVDPETKRIYTMGHPVFGGDGAVAYPAWDAEIATVVATLDSSFKAEAPGTSGAQAIIWYDGSFGAYGRIGKWPTLIPFEIVVRGSGFEDHLSLKIARGHSAFFELQREILKILAGYPLLRGTTNIEVVSRIMPEGLPELFSKQIYAHQEYDDTVLLGSDDESISSEEAEKAFTNLATLSRPHFETLKIAIRELGLTNRFTMKLEVSLVPYRVLKFERASIDKDPAIPGKKITLDVLFREEGSYTASAVTRKNATFEAEVPAGISSDDASFSVEDAETFTENHFAVTNAPENAGELIDYLNKRAVSLDASCAHLTATFSGDSRSACFEYTVIRVKGGERKVEFSLQEK